MIQIHAQVYGIYRAISITTYVYRRCVMRYINLRLTYLLTYLRITSTIIKVVL